MSVDELIDWLKAIYTQFGDNYVVLDGKRKTVGEVVQRADSTLDDMSCALCDFVKDIKQLGFEIY